MCTGTDRWMAGAVVLLACVVFSACSTRATTTASYVAPRTSGTLPRPAAVIVQDFTVDPSLVQVDQGAAARLHRSLAGTPVSTEQAQDAEAVRHAIADALTQEITQMGLPAYNGLDQLPTTPYVEVRGQVKSIDEGNKTRRAVVGFGAGKSIVSVVAEVVYITPGSAPQLLQSYAASSNSGHMPGLGVGAASAVAGHIGVAAANTGMHIAHAGNPVIDSEAEHLAKHLSVNIGNLFAQEQWIPQSAVPQSGLR